ncbi:MAG: FkbM family methyltransferase [Pirellulales bacterium]
MGGSLWGESRSALFNFCRRRLGLKPLLDRVQARQRLIGICDRPIRTVFDIGANVGKMAKLFRRRFPDAQIYCVEPLPACHARLEAWAGRQGGTAKLFKCAVGARPGEATIWWNTGHWGGSSLVNPIGVGPGAAATSPLRPLEVRLETLDRLASQVPVESEILVKIDVEGFELEVIRGGAETLGRASAVIVEVALLDSASRPEFLSVASALAELGYAYRGHLGCAWVNGIPHLADAVFLKNDASQRQAA